MCVQDVFKVAIEDLDVDFHQRTSIGFAEFRAGLSQLVDTWTDSAEPDAYADFLKDLLIKVTDEAEEEEEEEEEPEPVVVVEVVKPPTPEPEPVFDIFVPEPDEPEYEDVEWSDTRVRVCVFVRLCSCVFLCVIVCVW